MKIYSGFEDKRVARRARSAAVGIFDGVHRGHQKILRKVLSDARRLKTRSLAVTFEPHPNKILRPGDPHPILMSLQHRLRFFEKMGLAETLVIRFTKRFAQITREGFLKKLLGRLGVRTLAVGHDFRFGHRGEGDTRFLRERSRKLGFRLSVIPAFRHGREIISSTRIRRLIERGDLKKAGEMLGRPVSVYGTVVRGRGRGKTLGFPTANLNPHHETLPRAGVYAVWGLLDGRTLKGVVHIGARPTFGESDKSVEVHFLNFHGALYGRELELIFVRRLRPIRRFKSREFLVRAIRRDAAQALRILG
ncbi:MAG: riboflavin biosynthesis protein RibF [Candidatus Omnitrophota bacterium]